MPRRGYPYKAPVRAQGSTCYFPQLGRKRPRITVRRPHLNKVLEAFLKAPIKRGLPEWKRQVGIDATERTKELTLTELAEIHRDRHEIAGSRGNHDLFEVLVHFAFPDPNDLPYAYLVIWKVRDRMTNTRIAKRLGIGVQTARRYCEHGERLFWRFVKKLDLSQKLLNGQECITEESLIEEVARGAAG